MRLKYAMEDLPWHNRAAILGAAGVTLVLTDEQVRALVIVKDHYPETPLAQECP